MMMKTYSELKTLATKYFNIIKPYFAELDTTIIAYGIGGSYGIGIADNLSDIDFVILTDKPISEYFASGPLRIFDKETNMWIDCIVQSLSPDYIFYKLETCVLFNWVYYIMPWTQSMIVLDERYNQTLLILKKYKDIFLHGMYFGYAVVVRALAKNYSVETDNTFNLKWFYHLIVAICLENNIAIDPKLIADLKRHKMRDWTASTVTTVKELLALVDAKIPKDLNTIYELKKELINEMSTLWK